MAFGKRFSVHNNRPPVLVEKNCERCSGTGHIRERGSLITCKVCSGTGRTRAHAA